MTVNLRNNKIKFHKKKFEDWKVTLIDTGIDTQTGGRIKKIKNYVKSTFCLTYGDGISNVNILESIKFHKNNKKLATMTTVQPAGRFGAVEIEGNYIKKFVEKPIGDGGWINGGFFVLNKKLLTISKMKKRYGKKSH